MRVSAFVLAVLALPCLCGAQDVVDCHLVPGWEQTGARRSYTPDNLFDYKDGAAEGYLQFGFAHMQGADCKSGANTIAMDVSEMSDAEMAYGVFAANRDPRLPMAKIGMGGQVQPQSLTFARDKYYVELTVTDAAPQADFTAVLEQFAAKMNERLPGRDTPPEMLQWFPPAGLEEARLIPESVLGLRLLKRGYVAKYAQGQAFLVEEPSSDSAAELMQKLREHFAGAVPAKVSEATDAFAAKAQYLDGICIFRKGRFVAGYTNLADAAEATERCEQLAIRIPPE